MKKILKVVTIATAFAPLMVLAAEIGPGGIETKEILKEVKLQDIITSIANWATGLLVAISVLFVIYAAFIYLTTSGDPKGVEQAKNIIIYAVVAIAVALIANVVKTIVLGLVK